MKVVAMKRKIPMVHAPKILKKKKANGHHNNNNNNLKVLDDANPKRVHFDVRHKMARNSSMLIFLQFQIEQFLSREAGKGDRVEARERMLASLGAAPAKRGYVNYKDLKIDRAAKKAEAKAHAEMNHANSLSMLNIKKKNKKRK